MTRTITYGTLLHFLHELGFVTKTVPGSHSVHNHQETGCQLVYPTYEPGDPVKPHHLAATRRFLDEFGLVERDEFDEWLRQRSLAG
jgi:hypothetical protein